ncbi:MAG: NAD(P)-dependent oxidoreductase [Burkholderiales bacterium]|nr:NAD(P)-dependent oxidoreductase [Burkholderiales bacterium]
MAGRRTTTDGKRRVGVIGLGAMGGAMAANLVKAGFAVSGCDPVGAARAALRRAGGTPLRDAVEVARSSAFLILSLPSVAALEAVCANLARAGVRGVIAAETGTLPIEAKLAARDALARCGITLLDCPLSGTGAQARSGDLSVYASGDGRAIRAMAPVFEGFARSHFNLGAFGNGMRMKLVANLLVAIHNVSAAEALLMGVRSGLDAATVLKVIGDGAGSSRMFQVRGPMMVERTWDKATMSMALWQKDMRLIHDALLATETPAPLFAATVPLYSAALAQGLAKDDTGAVYAVLERMAGAPQRPTAAPRPRRSGAKAATPRRARRSGS